MLEDFFNLSESRKMVKPKPGCARVVRHPRAHKDSSRLIYEFVPAGAGERTIQKRSLRTELGGVDLKLVRYIEKTLMAYFKLQVRACICMYYIHAFDVFVCTGDDRRQPPQGH